MRKVGRREDARGSLPPAYRTAFGDDARQRQYDFGSEGRMNAKPAAASLVLSRHWGGLWIVLMVIAVDVLILGTLGGILGYFTMVLIVYGGEFLKGYDSVEAVLSLPMGWMAALLSVIAFLLFLRLDRTKHRTLSRNLFRSGVISVASAFVVTFALYLLVFLGLI